MSSLMTSPSSSAPASAWSVNQVKKLSGSSCCLFLPALFCVWLERLVRSYQEPEKAMMSHRLHKINAIWFKNLAENPCTECSVTDVQEVKWIMIKYHQTLKCLYYFSVLLINETIPFLISIWFLLTLKTGLRSHSNGILWKVLCCRSTGFRQNTRQDKMYIGKNRMGNKRPQKSHNGTYKIYSVAWLDVFKLCHFHSAQIMKCLLIFLSQ